MGEGKKRSEGKRKEKGFEGYTLIVHYGWIIRRESPSLFHTVVLIH